MRTVTYSRMGAAREVLSLGEKPDPEPGAGEVRVKVVTSGVNPADVKTRAGAPGRVMAFPEVIPHSDGGGVVDQVGEGVPPSRVGERVWLWNAQWRRPFGTAADYTVVPSEQAVRLPDHADFDVAACLGIPVMTAHHAVHCGENVAGQSVLVTGGAGAVGHYAIQFAKLAGAAKVFATASSDEKARVAQAAGADVVINYKSEDVGGRIRAEAEPGVDRIIEVDLGANHALLTTALRHGGTAVVYGSASNMSPGILVMPLLLRHVSLRYMSVYTLPAAARTAAIADIDRLLRANKLQHLIAAGFPLEETIAAHEAMESGKLIGKVVVRVQA